MGEKTRVLHVLKSSIFSGAENVAISIIKELEDKYEFAYLCTDGEIKDVLEKAGIQKFLLTDYTRREIQKVIRIFRPDIIHAHDFTATVLCASIRGEFRLISHLHYDPPWVKSWNLKTVLYRGCSKRIDTILSVSEKAYDNMVFSDLLRKKTRIVGNPIDIDKIKRLGDISEPADSYDLLFVGRLVEQKNPVLFIDIVKALCDKGFMLSCAMLGEGELRSECRKRITDYGLDGQIHLLGFQKNPYAYMNKAKIVCMTSKWEGYGLVLMEAAALGVPVVSSKTSGTAEVLGQSAPELCEHKQEFVDKLEMLLTNMETYQAWKNAAKARAENLTPFSKYFANIDGIYRRLLRG